MMKNLPLSIFLFILTTKVFAQSDSSTYVAGAISTDFDFTTTINSVGYGCNDTLLVSIPPGNFVTSIDLYYSIEALGTNWVSQQSSYLECLSTANKESSVAVGDQNWDSLGVANYQRTGLSVANGTSASGQLEFFLHAFRANVFFAGCSVTQQFVPDSSWKVVVHHIAPPTCFPPSNITSSARTSSSLTIDWVTGGASNWQLEYGLAGFTPGSGTVINVSSNPTTIGALLSDTEYDIRIKDSCAVGDVSVWSLFETFRTSCTAQSLPYSENFNLDIGCFNIIDGGTTTDTWLHTINGAQNLDGTGYLRADSDAFGLNETMDETLESPEINATGFAGQLFLNFDHYFRSIGLDSGIVDVWDGTNWVTVYTVTTDVGDWLNPNAQSIDITSYANANLKVRFIYKDGGGWAWYWSIDNFEVKTVSCVNPSNQGVATRDIQNVDVFWTSGGATNWNIEYGSQGFTQGSGTILMANNDTTNISGLTAGTCYDFYVQDSCAPGDVSAFIGPFTFCTRCTPFTAPWNENFDGALWTTGGGAANTGNVIDPCWERPNNVNPNFGTRTGASFSNGTGPTADASGTGNYLYTESSGGATGAGEIGTPYIIIPNTMVTPVLEFSYHMFGGNITSLEIQIDNGSGFGISPKVITGQQQTASADAWIIDTLNLTAYKGDTIIVKFIATNTGFSGDIAIDEIAVKEAPTCLDASNLGLSARGVQSADVFWTTGGANNWTVEYGSVGFTQGSGTILMATNDTTTISGLTAETCYDFYVQDSCGIGDVGRWVGPFTFCTSCNPFTAPWSENFDGIDWISGAGAVNTGNLIDQCWDRLNATNPNFGTRTGGTNTATSGPSGDVSGGGNYLYTEASFGATGAGEIGTPYIIIPNTMVTPILEFSYHMFGGNITSLEVQIDNGSGFGASLKVITGEQQTASADAWLIDSLNLTAYKGDTIIVKFIATNTGLSGDIAIDEVAVKEAPTCLDASNLGLSVRGVQNADVFWTTGGATNWNVEYGLTGFAQGSGTILMATNDTTTISGLSSGTCYDFYVQDSCAVGDVGNWVGPFTFCTSCNPFTAPWNENFDGITWISGNGAANTGNQVDACWERPDESNPNFGTRTGGTFSNGTGPTGDVSGAGNYLYTESSGSQGIGEITTPAIYIPNTMSTPILEFSYHMAGFSVLGLDIQIDNGNGFGANLKSIVTAQQNASADPWLSDTLDLTAFLGDTIYIKFLGSNNGFQGDIAIDEISVDEAPTCNDPIDLGLDAAFTNSASVYWTSGGANNWNIEYGAQGFTPGTGTILAALSDTTKINSLTASTCYDFYVQDSCGNGDASSWVGPFTFCTLCLPVTTPYLENFDGAAWTTGANNTDLGTIESCWVRTPQALFSWKSGPPPNLSGLTGPSVDHTSGTGGFIYSERIAFLPPNTTIEAYMQSPPIIVSGLTNPELTFWYHMYGNSVVDLDVDINNGTGWTNLYTRIAQQQTSGTDAWKEANINLLTYLGDTVIVRFKSSNNNGGTNNDVSIDDVSIDEAPSCPKPQDLQVAGFTNTTVTLEWVSGGSNNWNIEYGAQGFTQGSGTNIGATTNPFTITGLLANTSYDFYIQDSCGLGDVSDWIGSVSALTDCDPIAAPLIENFDGTAWAVSANNQTPGTLAACWRTNPDTGYAFTPGQNGTPTNNTGPSADNTTGADKFVYAETYYNFTGFNPNETVLSTPLVDVSTLTNPELKFFYHMFGGDITSLDVRVFDGSSWTSVATYTGAQQNANGDPWIEAIVDLIAYAGDTIKVEFRALKAVGFSLASDVAIDDFSLDEKPACSKPTNLTASNATANSIDLSWTTGGATMWEVEYGPAGFTPGTGTIIAALTNPFTVPGLSASTTYEFYVRDSCGLGNVSVWAGPVQENTLCLPTVAPYFENFDGTNFASGANGFGVPGTIDACWTRAQIATYFWKPGPSTPQTGGTGASADHTTGSGGYLFTESGGFAQPPQTAEVESPEIDLSTLTTPELTFWYHMFGPNVGTLEVEITNDGGLSWNNLQTLTGAQQTGQNAAWIESIIDISTYVNDTVTIRFTANKTTFGNQSDISIDDVGIDDAPNCPKPTALQITNITSTATTLSWISGGASNWQIEYGPTGFTNGSGTVINASTNPFTITGLTSNTGYDFYVKDSCGIGSVSDWSNVAEDTTNCSVFVAPFSESFDGSTFIVGGAIANPGEIDGCWERTFANTYFWATEQNGTVSANTGPSADHTTGAGKFLFTDGFGQPQQTELISPEIDLSSLTNPELRFWYHMYGATIDRMEIDVWDGSNWNNELTLNGQQHNASADPWTEAVVSLSSYLNDTVQVRMVGFRQGNQTANDMAIDDFWIGDSTSCARPDSAVLISSSTNSITIQWNNYSGIGSVLQYRPAGSTGAFIQQTTTGGSATLSGLSPSTTYEVFIKDSCGVGNISLWTSGYLFSTQCGAITAPWSENFNGAGWAPGTGNDNTGDEVNSCWTRATNTGIRWGTGTGGTNSGQTGPSGDVSGGGQYIYTEATIATGRSFIESPTIFIPTLLAQPTLEYYYHMFGAGIDSMLVEIDNGSGYTTHKFYVNQQQNGSGDPWLSDTIDLSVYSGDSVTIRFVGVNNTFRGDIAVDEVSIDGQITMCNEPTAISFSNIGNTSAVVNWTSNSGSSEIEIVPTGQAQGSGTLYSPVTSPFTVTGILPLTSYDVYIRDICGTQNSVWKDSVFTTTACPAVTVFFTSSDNLLNVSFDGSASTGADTLSWIFGDGNTSIGSATNTSNVYANPGIYTITLIGYNSCGNNDTVTQMIQICDSLVPDFSFTQLGDTLNFDGTSSFGASSFSWDFGDGTDTSDISAGLHKFTSSGNFTVTLTVYNDCGDSASISKSTQSCGPPLAKWTYTILGTTSQGMMVQFDGSTSLNASSYSWSFGDGNTNTTSAIPVHTYIVPSLQYTVSLTVSNLCGDSQNSTYRLDQIGLTELLAEERKLEIYPNPASDLINIRIKNGGTIDSGELQIYDVSGKEVLHQKLSIERLGNETIDVKSLPPGHYTLRITDDGLHQHYPLILK